MTSRPRSVPKYGRRPGCRRARSALPNLHTPPSLSSTRYPAPSGIIAMLSTERRHRPARTVERTDGAGRRGAELQDAAVAEQDQVALAVGHHRDRTCGVLSGEVRPSTTSRPSTATSPNRTCRRARSRRARRSRCRRASPRCRGRRRSRSVGDPNAGAPLYAVTCRRRSGRRSHRDGVVAIARPGWRRLTGHGPAPVSGPKSRPSGGHCPGWPLAMSIWL